MSEENMELVHRAYAALQAGDLEEFLTYVSPDVEWHSLFEIGRRWEGHDGVREWWAEVHKVFPDWNPSIVTARQIGEYVIVHARGAGTGAASGVGIDQAFWQVARIERDQIVWYRAVRSEQEALEAAGSRE
jgi:ketosteroid isomerase-like protein